MRFVRSQYPDVVLHRPEINIYKLIEKKKIAADTHQALLLRLFERTWPGGGNRNSAGYPSR